jgi:hypothetical protein
MRLVLLPLFIFISACLEGQSTLKITDKEALNAISKGNTEIVEAFIIQGNNIDGLYGRKKTTLLNHAIKRKSSSAFNQLLSLGADPNKISQELTPIMHAVQRKNMQHLHRLLRSGANIDATGKGGQTALILAAKQGKFNFVKTLIEWGADAEKRNNAGLSALDVANMSNYRDVAIYLVKAIELRHFFANMPAERDGPHIEWINDTLVRMYYLMTDPKKKYPVMDCDFFPALNDTVILDGFAYDSLRYKIVKLKTTDAWDYQNVSKTLAIGDIHGQYTALKNYLINNGVINKNHEWIWGDGHLVLLGDIFDRGDQVTESLWLIHKLDIQSRAHGGRVHMLLGNHEIMAMINDIRYVSSKYKQLSNYFSKEYADFYGLNTELGQWLRKRNAVIRINDCIFSHAGISSHIIKNNFTIPRINFLITNFLSDDPEKPNEFVKETNLVLGKYGPLWYRGFMYDFPDEGLISKNEVVNVLETLGASKFVIAHSHVESVTFLYDESVIAIDVPVHKTEVISEGLLIENGSYYRLKYNGEKILLKEKK